MDHNTEFDHIGEQLAMHERELLEGPSSRTWAYPYTDPCTDWVPEVSVGVDRLIDDYAGLEPEAPVAVVWTPDARIAASWLLRALEQRGHEPILIPMRPILDDGLESRLDRLLAGTSPTRLTVFTLETHTMSHGAVLRPLAAAGATVVRAIGAGTDLFTQALKVGPDELDARNRALWSHVGAASAIRVSTTSGTDLEIGLDHDRHRWIYNAGLRSEGSFVVVPSGEIATYSSSVNGALVADFALHTNEPCPFDTRLAQCPVTLQIKDSVVVDVDTSHDGIRSYLEQAFAIPDANRVGEVGFGTNLGVTEAIDGNSHVNERNGGLHLGIGQHNQPRSAVPYRCKTHIDLIASDGVVTTDAGAVVDLRGPIDALGWTDTTGLAGEDLFAGRV